MRRFIVFLCISITLMIYSTISHADDTALFIKKIPPDVLILLDMSGSMNWAPSGSPASYPNRRIDIARQVLRGLLDSNGDGEFDEKDEKILNVRLGYMRFRASNNNDDGEPNTGSIRVLSEMGSSYKNIWDQINDPNETAVGGTPLAAALGEAKTYFLRDINPRDPALACRKKFVILISDGADTFGCSGNGVDPNCSANEEDSNPGMKRRRMLTVQRAKELYDAGIKLYVVGFGGGMPECLTRTLNWAAYYGGTDKYKSGDSPEYKIADYGESCSIDLANTAADPASYPLSGFAFITENASQLSDALKKILEEITTNNYFFTSPAVPSVRVICENENQNQNGNQNKCNIMYIADFKPNESPFWPGYLKAYWLNEHGTLEADTDGKPLNAPIWDTGEELNTKPHDSRKIYTFVRGAMREFTSGNISKEDLEVENDAVRDTILKYVRGNTEGFPDTLDLDQDGITTTEPRPYKLGDIFHSNPVIVGSPSRFFRDEGFSGVDGFYEEKKKRTRVIIAGANDGMLHAFNAGDWNESSGGHDQGTGDEEWAFIPPSVLDKLKFMTSQHTYYVDSSPKVADVWFYSSPTDTTKSKDEWRTVLVCGLRKGGKHYFALDITDTKNPRFLWEFTDSEMGESWSEPAIGRVKIEVEGELYERWVAFIGAGFDQTEKRDRDATIGRGFYVIDIKTGQIIKKFSGLEGMRSSFASAPTTVDINLDGYIDKVYIGDLGGRMWVFDVSFNPVTKKSDSQWSGIRLFQAPGSTAEKHPIYYQPAVAFDRNRIPWVYFGTGDRENPNDTSNPPERFYAIRDDGLGNYPRVEDDLKDVTTINTFTPDSAKKGWFIKLERVDGRHEKVLAKPTVFNRLVYFTTYSYKQTNDPCQVKGDAKLYIVEYLSGGGALMVDELTDLSGTPSDRSKVIGEGIPSAPVISVNTQGEASVIVGTTSGEVFSQKAFSPTSNKDLLYWREVVR